MNETFLIYNQAPVIEQIRAEVKALESGKEEVPTNVVNDQPENLLTHHGSNEDVEMSNVCDSSNDDKVENDGSKSSIDQDEISTIVCYDSKCLTAEIDDSKCPTVEIDDSKCPTAEIDIPKSPTVHHDSSPGSGVSGDNEKSGDTSDFDEKSPGNVKTTEKVLGNKYFVQNCNYIIYFHFG